MGRGVNFLTVPVQPVEVNLCADDRERMSAILTPVSRLQVVANNLLEVELPIIARVG